MRSEDLSGIFENSPVFFPDHMIDAGNKPWYSPPGWNGVYLKDIIPENETGGKFSYHLVRIQENCEVGDHLHDLQWEWNVVLQGDGYFLLGDKKIPVKPGQTYATPPGISHTVRAGKNELLLLAMFIPAL